MRSNNQQQQQLKFHHQDRLSPTQQQQHGISSQHHFIPSSTQSLGASGKSQQVYTKKQTDFYQQQQMIIPSMMQQQQYPMNNNNTSHYQDSKSNSSKNIPLSRPETATTNKQSVMKQQQHLSGVQHNISIVSNGQQYGKSNNKQGTPQSMVSRYQKQSNQISASKQKATVKKVSHPKHYEMTVRVIEANLKVNKSFFGQMNVYLILKMDGHPEHHTKTDSGQNPKWDQNFIFHNIQPKSKLELAIYDKGIIRENFIGHTFITFDDLQSISFRKPFAVNDKDQCTGQLDVKITLKSKMAIIAPQTKQDDVRGQLKVEERSNGVEGDIVDDDADTSLVYRDHEISRNIVSTKNIRNKVFNSGLKSKLQNMTTEDSTNKLQSTMFQNQSRSKIQSNHLQVPSGGSQQRQLATESSIIQHQTNQSYEIDQDDPLLMENCEMDNENQHIQLSTEQNDPQLHFHPEPSNNKRGTEIKIEKISRLATAQPLFMKGPSMGQSRNQGIAQSRSHAVNLVPQQQQQYEEDPSTILPQQLFYNPGYNQMQKHMHSGKAVVQSQQMFKPQSQKRGLEHYLSNQPHYRGNDRLLRTSDGGLSNKLIDSQAVVLDDDEHQQMAVPGEFEDNDADILQCADNEEQALIDMMLADQYQTFQQQPTMHQLTNQSTLDRRYTQQVPASKSVTQQHQPMPKLHSSFDPTNFQPPMQHQYSPLGYPQFFPQQQPAPLMQQVLIPFQDAYGQIKYLTQPQQQQQLFLPHQQHQQQFYDYSNINPSHHLDIDDIQLSINNHPAMPQYHLQQQEAAALQQQSKLIKHEEQKLMRAMEKFKQDKAELQSERHEFERQREMLKNERQQVAQAKNEYENKVQEMELKMSEMDQREMQVSEQQMFIEELCKQLGSALQEAKQLKQTKEVNNKLNQIQRTLEQVNYNLQIFLNNEVDNLQPLEYQNQQYGVFNTDQDNNKNELSTIIEKDQLTTSQRRGSSNDGTNQQQNTALRIQDPSQQQFFPSVVSKHLLMPVIGNNTLEDGYMTHSNQPYINDDQSMATMFRTNQPVLPQGQRLQAIAQTNQSINTPSLTTQEATGDNPQTQMYRERQQLEQERRKFEESKLYIANLYQQMNKQFEEIQHIKDVCTQQLGAATSGFALQNQLDQSQQKSQIQNQNQHPQQREEEKQRQVTPLINDIQVEDEEDSVFIPDPDFLKKINQNMQLNDKHFNVMGQPINNTRASNNGVENQNVEAIQDQYFGQQVDNRSSQLPTNDYGYEEEHQIVFSQSDHQLMFAEQQLYVINASNDGTLQTEHAQLHTQGQGDRRQVEYVQEDYIDEVNVNDYPSGYNTQVFQQQQQQQDMHQVQNPSLPPYVLQQNFLSDDFEVEEEEKKLPDDHHHQFEDDDDSIGYTGTIKRDQPVATSQQLHMMIEGSQSDLQTKQQTIDFQGEEVEEKDPETLLLDLIQKSKNEKLTDEEIQKLIDENYHLFEEATSNANGASSGAEHNVLYKNGKLYDEKKKAVYGIQRSKVQF